MLDASPFNYLLHNLMSAMIVVLQFTSIISMF